MTLPGLDQAAPRGCGGPARRLHRPCRRSGRRGAGRAGAGGAAGGARARAAMPSPRSARSTSPSITRRAPRRWRCRCGRRGRGGSARSSSRAGRCSAPTISRRSPASSEGDPYPRPTGSRISARRWSRPGSFPPSPSARWRARGPTWSTSPSRIEPAPMRTIAGEAGYGTGEGVRLELSWQHRNLLPPEGAVTFRGVAGTREQLVSGDPAPQQFRAARPGAERPARAQPCRPAGL